MSLRGLTNIVLRVTGARGAMGIDLQGTPTSGQFLVKAPGGGRTFLTASGTGADNGLRTDLAAPGGAANVGFQQGGTSPLTRSAQAKLREVEVSITDFGAIADGATDNRTSIINALAFAALIGGAAVIPSAAQSYAFSGAIQVPNGVALRGRCHNGKDSIGASLLALNSASQIRFGGQGSANVHFSGHIGDFNIDGGAVATDPLYMGRGSDRHTANLHVRNTAPGGTAIRVEELQNAVFINVRPTDGIGGKGWVFDRGTGGHILIGCNSNDTGDTGIYITETWGGGLAQGLYAVPSQIDFFQPIVERDSTGKALYVGACSDITFHSAIFGSNSSTAAVNLCNIAVEAGRSIARLRFHDCQFFGSQTFSTALAIGNGADVIFTGRPKFNSLLAGMNVTAGATVDMKDYAASAVTTMFVGTGAADTYVRSRFMQAIQFTRTAVSDTIIAALNVLTGQYFRLRADGRMDWGDGTNFTLDTNLYRSAANVLKTDDTLSATIGVAPGSYTVATLPAANSVPVGTIVRVTDGNHGAECYARSNGSASWNVIATIGAAVSAT